MLCPWRSVAAKIARAAEDHEKQMRSVSAMMVGMEGYEKLRRSVAAKIARAAEDHQYFQKRASLGFPYIIKSGLSVNPSHISTPEQCRTPLLESSPTTITHEVYEEISPEIIPAPSPSPRLVPITSHEKVFIVHGHDHAARDTVEDFVDNWGLTPTVLDEQPNKGRTIIEKFEEQADEVSFAIALLTPDDVGASKKNRSDLKPRARQNVIFELGYFIKALGRQQVCILCEEGVELPSDIQGIVYIPMDDAGEWQQRVIREMVAADILVDLNKNLRKIPVRYPKGTRMPTLDFKGKQFIYGHHLTVPVRTLKINKDRSLTDDNDPSLNDNLIIHGDNLHALKALLPKYAGRIKCIYIDPPYNTGSQAWVYNDRVNSPLMQAWFAQNSPVDGEDLERHDKWLCMMWPRLHLLRELLSDDGVIFVSIDHHEQHHLRMMMDEIFGAETFIVCLAAVLNLKGSRDNRGFTTTHESVLVYEKVARSAILHEVPLHDDGIDDWLEDNIGWYKKGANLKYSGENAPREKRPNLFYPIYVHEDGTVGVEPKSGTSTELWPIADENKEVTWRWGRDTVAANPDEILAIQSGDSWALHKKQRPPVGVVPSKKPKSTFYSPKYSATTATTTVKEIFDKLGPRYCCSKSR